MASKVRFATGSDRPRIVTVIGRLTEEPQHLVVDTKGGFRYRIDKSRIRSVKI